MQLVDTHSHIFYKDYDGDRDAVVARARDVGVAAIFDVGLDIETNITVINNAEKYESVFPIAGFHPHEASRFEESSFRDFMAKYSDRSIAFGEIGLDYFRDHSPHDVQRKSFDKQLEIMLPTGKPLIFHSRASDDDMIAALKSAAPKIKGVMHCFSGGPAFLEKVLEIGLHISVGGPVTYPKSDGLLDIIRMVPLNRLLLETDCPYLTPQFRRGKRNEPSYVPIIAQKIAEERKISVEALAFATTENVKDLFGDPVAAYLETAGG